MTSKATAARLTLGPLPAIHRGLALALAVGSGGFVTLFPALFESAFREEPEALLGFGGALVGGVVLVSLMATISFRRLGKVQRGTPGRGRLRTGAVTSVLAALALLLPLFVLRDGVTKALEQGFLWTFDFNEVFMSLDPVWRLLLLGGAAAYASLLLVDLGLAIASWFVLPRVLRQGFWVLFDLGIVAAFVWLRVDFADEVEGPLLPIRDGSAAFETSLLRLAVSTLLIARLGIRLLPVALDVVERIGYQPLVAARHLRAKKSGFLATISGLSILAVGVSTSMLVTVLSVMGGFRADLKRKILGSHAHVAVSGPPGSDGRTAFEGWDPVLQAVRDTPGIRAATPYAQGEVMLRSSSGSAGARYRGIDPASVAEVTDLERNLRRGRLEYLVHPEMLLDLPPEERRMVLPMDLRPDAERDAGERNELGSGWLSEEDLERGVQETLERHDREQRAGGADDATLGGDELGDIEDAFFAGIPETEIEEDSGEGRVFGEPDALVLPGLILGRELARTLRVVVGDEVDVVSPLGELGPTGMLPKSRRYRVAGIFYSGMYEYDMKLAYTTLEGAQSFLGMGDAISGIEARVDPQDVDRAPQIAAAVRTRIDRDQLMVNDWQELNRSLFGALAIEKLAMFITLGLAILIAGFCVFGTLTLMVQEKSREVGILKAMGTSERAIVQVFLIEGLLIGAFGAAIGLGLGYLLAFGFERFPISLNPELYYIDRLPVSIDATEFSVVGLAAVGICLVATIFPAYLASKLRPVDALARF